MSKKTEVRIKFDDMEYSVFVDTDNPNMAMTYVESLLKKYVTVLKCELRIYKREVSDG